MNEVNNYMNYEEKRELRLQISQMLSDAGMNQARIKELVNEEIRNKVNRAIEQCIKRLDAETSNGDYIDTEIRKMLRNTYISQSAFTTAVKKELENRIIKIVVENKEE